MKAQKLFTGALIIMGTILLSTFSSCTKPNGRVIFWTLDTDGVGYVTVTLNNVNSNITVDKTTTPDCDASGCAVYSLAEGTYNYTAAETTTGTNGTMDTWSGTVTITSEGCLAVKLVD